MPPIVLMTVLVLLGLVMVPVFAIVVMAFVSQLSKGRVTNEMMGIAFPIIVGFPIAVVLWRRSRRAETVRGAWILAVVGVLVLGGVSYRPVSDVGAMFYEEWKETQPGGRGY
ncbi:hypothetical protein [Amycolatopsis sp.]|jgi:peptidoglycan/LPS O-acetylase OafA/YrhL|uniref:hypothetical protein n=1 Tax=Amycolatopsis sp. TaxID=37632 RepID=UPI002E18F2B4